ncbi:LEA domain-containing protein [Ilyonectria robusta]
MANRGKSLSQIPRSEAPPSEVPSSEVPGSEASKSAVSGIDIPKSVVTGAEIPKGEIPEGEIPEGEVPEEAAETENKLDYSALKGCTVNKGGNLINDKRELIGRVVEGEVKKLVGKKADDSGDIWNDAGKKIGKGEPLPDSEREDLKDFAPFENFPDAIVEEDGRVLFEGKQVGQVIEGDPKRLKGSKVDEDGDILDRRGNVIGKAEAWDEPEEEAEPEIDYSILADKRVNRAGNVVGSNGDVYGRVIEGHIGSLVGRMCDKDGNVRSESGEIIGRVELVPEDQRETKTQDVPFADLDGCTVTKEGKVATSTGKIVGSLITGDAKAPHGCPVDEDGDIVDRNGNVIGKAERWEEPEAEPEPEIDYSILAGKRVNKAGNVVGSNGELFGRVIEGHIGSLVGRMCDKDGNVRGESGEVIGRAELVPEDQREGTRDGPFADLAGCTVAHEGKVATSTGEIVGRLVSGNAKALYGRPVDEDGDILDRNGNVIGKAERWEEPEAEPEPKIDYSSLAGKRVNKAGNVVGSNGEIYGRRY